jgi:hypothetical protein
MAINAGVHIVCIQDHGPLSNPTITATYPSGLTQAYELPTCADAVGMVRKNNYTLAARNDRLQLPDIMFEWDTVVIVNGQDHFWHTKYVNIKKNHDASALMQEFKRAGGVVQHLREGEEF